MSKYKKKFNTLVDDALKVEIQSDRSDVEAIIEDNREKASVLFDQYALLNAEARELVKNADKIQSTLEECMLSYMKLSFKMTETLAQLKEVVSFNELVG